MSASDYEIEAVLDEGRARRVLRARRRRDGLPVVVKHLRPGVLGLADRIEQEFTLLRRICAPEVVGALALDDWHGAPALILAVVDGTPLGAWIRRPRGPADLLERLHFALGLVRALAVVHAAGVLHRDIKPSNIVVTPDRRVVLIDFSAATLARDGDARDGEGTLQYMAPEQTGRTGRQVDARSDHYALGVTLYELFTGRLPFADDDPLGLVHSHLARVPPDPRSVSPELPAPLAAIILKLLEKSPDNRYQSMPGLRADLQRCHDQLRDHGHIDPFPPGLADISPQLRLPERLFGRDEPRRQLLAALARAHVGDSTLVLVRGPPGAGKSALVTELLGPASRLGATVALGEFDPAARDLPHAALLAALEPIVRRRLADPEASLVAWRAHLGNALGPVAGLACDLLPALAALLGPQPPVPELPPAESAQRFLALMLRLVRALAPANRPFVLVLDDLQHADHASLRLVLRLLQPGEVPGLLVVACVRDDALGSPALLELQAALAAAHRPAEILALEPLSLADTTALVAATLAWPSGQAHELASFLHARADGNPLFTRALLRWLHEQGLLHLDLEAGAWRWDAERSAATSPGDDVGALLAGKLADLDPPVRAALELAACLGTRFSPRRIAAVLEDSPQDTAAALAEAQARGLVQPVAGAGEALLEFAHDRVRQAAYALADPPRLRTLHLRLGRSMLADDPAHGEGDSLFTITTHYNHAADIPDGGDDLLPDPHERLRLAELNLAAARRALQATAFAAAALYCRHGCALLRPDAWTHHYALCFALHGLRMQCEHLAGNIPVALAQFEPLLRHARDDLDRAEIHDLKVRLEVSRERYLDSVRTGLAGLRLLGIDLPEHPSQAAILRELAAIRWQRGLRPIAALAALPPASDPRIVLALRLLAHLTMPAYFVSEAALALLTLRVVTLSIRHGVTQDSAYGFAVYASITNNRFDDHDGARDLLTVAEALHTRYPGPHLAVQLAYVGGYYVEAWLHPFAHALARIEAQIEPAVALGDTTLASNHHAARCDLQWLGRGDLPTLERCVASARHHARNFNGFDHAHWFIPLERACLALRGHTDHLASLDSPDWSERALHDHLGPLHIPTTFYYTLFKATLQLHAGEFRDAERLCHLHHRIRLEGVPSLADLLLLRVLARAAQAPTRPITPSERPHLQRWLRRLQLWSRACPDNHAARALLAEAELARADDHHDAATTLYLRAVEAARASGQLRLEGLAFERAARHLRARSLPVLSDMYLRAARDAYARFGALALCARLDAEFPLLAPAPPLPEPTPPPRRPGLRETTTTHTDTLDIESLLRASQVLSGEIELDRLLRALVRIVLESAGARRCAVLLARDDGELRVEALADLEHTDVLQGLPLAELPQLPAALIHLAARGRRDVILDDATTSDFAGDPSIARLRSVLCTPIVHQGALRGVLYLDNDLAPGTFTAARVALLRQLAGQVAISVENARLYRGLGQARDAAVAADRTKTRFLMNMSHELRTPLNAVLGYTELIQESAADNDLASLHTDLEKIRRAAHRLLRTLSNILELSRLEAGDFHPAPEPIDLGQLLREIHGEAAPLAALQDDQLQFSLPPALPPIVSDRSMLTHCLRSLVDNALRFTLRGRVDITISPYLSEGTPWLAITVADTGIGIAPADLPRLFTSFGQLDDAPTRNFEGTGVSLALTRRYCALLGARVEVDSRPGHGSKFTIHLPATPV